MAQLLLKHVDLALILLVPLLEVLLVVHGQQRLGIGILGRLQPAVHLFGKSPWLVE